MADQIDITVFNCKHKCCCLQHGRNTADWISHFLVRFENHIKSADVVLIERQPPMGHKCVEQLLFQACRSKAVLIHPRSFHSFFHIGHMDYDHRKSFVTDTVKQIFKDSDCVEWLMSQKDTRTHDVADALLFVVYYINQPAVKRELIPIQLNDMNHCEIDNSHDFNQFRYKKRRRKNIYK